MIRGTTPTIQFALPVEASELSCLYITLSQKDQTIAEKEMTDCTFNGAVVTCRLSQEDTLALDCKEYVEIQARAKTKNGDTLASNIYTTTVGRILKEGVI